MSKSSTQKIKSIDVNKHVSSSMVAEAVGCSTRMVTYVWNGDRRFEAKKGEAIEVATIILNECIATGMIKAKKIIGDVQSL